MEIVSLNAMFLNSYFEYFSFWLSRLLVRVCCSPPRSKGEKKGYVVSWIIAYYTELSLPQCHTNNTIMNKTLPSIKIF
jgi:hypothetical protein